jgi:hypothetical protein
MFIAGEYDLALSAAPAVSYNFWQNLMVARAELEKGSEEGADLALIAGKPEEAITQLMALKKFDSAMLIAASMRNCPFAPRTKSVAVKPAEGTDLPFVRTDFQMAEDFGTYVVASKRSLKFALEGKPLLSAACLLTVGDVNGAAWRLLHCGELIWAVEVNRCSESPDTRITDTFTRYAIYNGCAEQIFPTLSNATKRKMAPLVPFEDDDQRNDFYARHGMKTCADYYSEAKKSRGFARSLFLILAGRTLEAAVYTVQCLKAILAAPSFDFADAYKYIELIQDAYVDHPEADPVWQQIIALSLYFAVYNAMWRRYSPVVETMTSAFKDIVSKENIDWLSPRVEELKAVAALTVAARKVTDGIALAGRLGAQAIVASLQGLPPDSVADGGSTVTPRSNGVVSVDLGEPEVIWGVSNLGDKKKPFRLEDQKTTMGLDEALMWFDVTPFSPLPTHKKHVAY